VGTRAGVVTQLVKFIYFHFLSHQNLQQTHRVFHEQEPKENLGGLIPQIQPPFLEQA
jgi:hypothetical protein